MLVSIVIAAVLVVPSATVAAPRCRVVNEDSGHSFGQLRSAVKTAQPDQALLLSGTCSGKTVIDRDITIRGVQVPGSGRPTIIGWRSFARILKVTRGAEATISDLTFDAGDRRDADGGAILNRGDLTLHDVTIRDYHAPNAGGGVLNEGNLILSGDTRITNNRAGRGGGVDNRGKATLELRDDSRVSGNIATLGGGVANAGRGTVILRGSSAIEGNLARSNGAEGGGIWQELGGRPTVILTDSSRIQRNQAVTRGSRPTLGGGVAGGRVEMDDASRITENEADHGGGVECASLVMEGSSVITGNIAHATFGGVRDCEHMDPPAGVVCGTDGNVHGNSPNDCVITRFPVVTPELPMATDPTEPDRYVLDIVGSDYGDEWPFTVDSGTLACEQGRVTFESPDGQVWALDETAIAQGAEELDATIWRLDARTLESLGIPGAEDGGWENEAELRSFLAESLPDRYPEKVSMSLAPIVDGIPAQCET